MRQKVFLIKSTTWQGQMKPLQLRILYKDFITEQVKKNVYGPPVELLPWRPHRYWRQSQIPSFAFLSPNQAWLLTSSPSTLSWKQLHQVLPPLFFRISQRLLCLSCHHVTWWLRSSPRSQGGNSPRPSPPISDILCPISARYQTTVKYHWVQTHTRSERGGDSAVWVWWIPYLYKENHLLCVPSFLCLLPASKALGWHLLCHLHTPCAFPYHATRIKV